LGVLAIWKGFGRARLEGAARSQAWRVKFKAGTIFALCFVDLDQC
jgi:hypothetical protein